MGRERAEDLDELRALARRESRGRLVEQDEAWGAGERERDLELALLAVAQLRDQAIAHVGEVHRLDEIDRRLHEGIVAGGRSSEKRPRETPRHAEVDVVEHTEVPEQGVRSGRYASSPFGSAREAETR